VKTITSKKDGVEQPYNGRNIFRHLLDRRSFQRPAPRFSQAAFPVKRGYGSPLYSALLIGSLFFNHAGYAAETTQPSAPPQGEAASAPGIAYGAEADFNSRYLWRGLALSRGAVFQPSVWASKNNWTLDLWANVDLGRHEGRGRFNEVDVNVAYEHEWGKLTVEPSFLLYTYYHQPGVPTTGELAVKLSLPAGKGLTAYAKQNLDVVKYGGANFTEAGLTFETAVAPHATLETTGSLGWGSSKFNETYVGLSHSGLNVVGADAAVKLDGKHGWTLRPHATYSVVADRKLRRLVSDTHLFNIGMALDREW
jgi:hypothetical protein